MTLPSQAEWKARALKRVKRVVVKIGSSLLSDSDGINRARLRGLVKAMAAVHERPCDVVIVTSGAVAAGVARLGRKERPRAIPQRQAAAAVGQISLIARYEEYFDQAGIRVAQILLTHDDLADRRRYINAKHTFGALLQARVIPVVNENDTVAIEELNFGDNDNLSALVAAVTEADLLLILSDVAGVYTTDPRQNADASLIPVLSGDRAFAQIDAGGAGSVGTGGMATKLAAARKAASTGIPTFIADGQHPQTIAAVFDPGVETGTLILPGADRLTRRKHWIAYTLRPAGSVVVDDGGVEAIRLRGRSLLPSGVREVQGRFEAGDCVSIRAGGKEVARGLVNYSAAELEKIKGAHSSRIETILGYKISDEVVHRDDLALLEPT